MASSSSSGGRRLKEIVQRVHGIIFSHHNGRRWSTTISIVGESDDPFRDLVSAAHARDWRLVHRSPVTLDAFIDCLSDKTRHEHDINENDTRAVLSVTLEAAIRKDLEDDQSFARVAAFVETITNAIKKHHEDLSTLLPLDTNILTMALTRLQARKQHHAYDKLVLMHLDYTVQRFLSSSANDRQTMDISPFLLYLNLLTEANHERNVKKALMIYCQQIRPMREKNQQAEDVYGIIGALCSTPRTSINNKFHTNLQSHFDMSSGYNVDNDFSRTSDNLTLDALTLGIQSFNKPVPSSSSSAAAAALPSAAVAAAVASSSSRSSSSSSSSSSSFDLPLEKSMTPSQSVSRQKLSNRASNHLVSKPSPVIDNRKNRDVDPKNSLHWRATVALQCYRDYQATWLSKTGNGWS